MATIRVWVIGPDASVEASYGGFLGALAEFRRAHPLRRVEAEAFPAEGYGERLAAALAADGGPDVFACYGGTRLRRLVSDGRVLALDPHLDDPFRAGILPDMTGEFLIEGKTYGLPLGAHAAVLFCNRDLFHSFGLAAPATFDALLDAVRTFRRGGTQAFALGYRERWPAALLFETLAAARAGGGAAAPGAAVRELVRAGQFDDPAFLAAAYDVKRLVDAGAFRQDAADLSMFAEGLEAFRDGRAAMMFHGSWLAGTLESDDSRVRGRIDVAAFPGAAAAAAPGAAAATTPGGSERFILWGGAFLGLCVNAKSAHPAEAAAFVKGFAPLQDRISWRSAACLPSYKGSLEAKGTPAGLGSQIAALMRRSTGFAPNWDLTLEEKAEQGYLDAVAGLFSGALAPERFLASLVR